MKADGEAVEISERIVDNPYWLIGILSIVIPIVISEIGECSTRICQWMINTAAAILGAVTTREVGDLYKEEWSATLLRLPGKLTKILLTTSILLRALPRLWWILAGQGVPVRLLRRLKLKITIWQRAIGSPKPGVEITRLDRRHVAMRSRSTPAGIIIFSNTEFNEFLAAVKNGEYNLGLAS